ncbi:hypothetical protein [Apilactobacillus timberlakei]|nr:hypothetical protein [Apilactobacillus timberlakei]TPR18123.1 hypothetical protein DYZ95_02145 [Apilactobacillus timberlakei]
MKLFFKLLSFYISLFAIVFLGLNYAFSDGGIGGPAYNSSNLITKSLYITLIILILLLILQNILLFIKINRLFAIIFSSIIVITSIYSLCINFVGHQMYIAAIISTLLFWFGNNNVFINKKD